MRKICKPNFTLRKIRKPNFTLRKIRKGCEKICKPKTALQNPIRNLEGCANPIHNPKVHFISLCEIPMVNAKTKGHLKAYLKTFKACFHFAHPIPIAKTLHQLANRLSLHSTPCGQPFQEATSISCPILDMARIREGHTDPSLSREPRPKASSPQDSTFQAPEASNVPFSKGGVPSNPPQCRYATRRPSTSPPPKPSIRRIPPKRAKTLGPKESFRHSQPDPRVPTDSQHPSGISPEAIIKRLMVITLPIEGNSDCRARPFHFELYFDLEAMRQQLELRDSFGLL